MHGRQRKDVRHKFQVNLSNLVFLQKDTSYKRASQPSKNKISVRSLSSEKPDITISRFPFFLNHIHRVIRRGVAINGGLGWVGQVQKGTFFIVNTKVV